MPTEATTKLSESAANSGCTSGSPKKSAMGQERASPISVKPSPAATLVQNTVERSASVSTLRCTRAAPNARSEKTRTRLAKTRTIPATP